MNAKIKISLLAVTSLIAMAGYSKLYEYSFDAPRVASWWLKDVIVKKELLSKKTDGKRIVIISGSNGLFGFDGERMQKETGLPVVNLALHASLDLNFYRWIAERNIRKGDIVIVPLEFNYYTLSDSYNSWFIDNMLAWGRDYLGWISPIEYWRFLSHVEFKKVASGSLSNWHIQHGSSYKTKLHSSKEIAQYQYDGSFHEYDFRSVDETGGILAPKENKRDALPLIEHPEKNKAGLYYMKDSKLTAYGLSSASYLIKSIENMGAKVFATWPTSMSTVYFRKDDALSEKMIRSIKKEMEKSGVEMHCSPWDVNIDPSKFYDTAYHLNKAGAEIRTKAVVECMKNEGVL